MSDVLVVDRVGRVGRMMAQVVLVVLAIGVVDTLVDALPDDDSVDNMHALQADAFLDGTLELSHEVEDVATYQGKVYSPYPPAPAVLLVPLVAVFGLHGPLPTLTALVLTGVAVWLAWRICEQVGLARGPTAVAIGGLFLGTAFWSCVLESREVWFFAHVVAVTFLLAAFDAALRNRALAAGLFLGGAVLSRQLTIFALPFLVALLLDENDDEERRPSPLLRIAAFLAPLAVCVGVYCWMNAVRFTGPFDTGYQYIDLATGFLDERVEFYGLFDVAYVPFNFVHMFLQGYHLDYAGEQMLTPAGNNAFGTSLTFASPFLFFALLARPERPDRPDRPGRRLLVAAWVSVGLCLVGELLYYNNGFAQTNAQRFSLDFVPMLFVLLVWGVQRAKTRLWQAAVALAVALNFFALVVVPRLDYVDRLFQVDDELPPVTAQPDRL